MQFWTRIIEQVKHIPPQQLNSIRWCTGTLLGVTTDLTRSSSSASATDYKMLLEREAKHNDWRKSFLEIETKVYTSDRFSCLTNDVALRRSNSLSNRYPNVLAYDHSRVHVSHNNEDLYINANLVRATEADRKYILTQGPLKETVDDFWLMVYQYSSPTIVMLCSCYENNMPKSWQYWPLEVGHTMVLGEDREGLELEVSLVNCEDRGHFLIRSFVLTDTGSGEKRKVKQYHYLDWPDFNVPKSPKHFLEFLYAIRDSGCFLENSGPPIVHCSAGIGRSGTLILVDTCLVLASLGVKLDLKLVLETLLDLRTYRKGLIQTEQQLKFSVDAIVQGLREMDVEDDNDRAVHLNGKRLKDTDTDEDDNENHSNAKKRKNSQS